MQREELSERALALTEEVLGQNAANYTAWYYRRRVLEALGKDLTAELAWLVEVGEDSPKNYQIWYHRQWAVDRHGEVGSELDFTSRMIAADSKNYHAWSYRQWLVRRFALAAGEWAYIDQLLDDDLRNNSAWNHRFWLHKEQAGGAPLAREVVDREVAYAQAFIAKAPSNESPWVFMRGVMEASEGGLAACGAVREWVSELLQKQPHCVHAMGLLLEMFEAEGSADKLKVAASMCDVLGGVVDTIRASYWAHRKAALEAKSAATSTA